MPQEPKKRHSRARQGKRRASIKLVARDPKHKLTHFYALMEKDRSEIQKKQKSETPSGQEE